MGAVIRSRSVSIVGWLWVLSGCSIVASGFEVAESVGGTETDGGQIDGGQTDGSVVPSDGSMCGNDEALCEGSCVDTRTSVSHCGACGTVCEGPCVQGVCDPVVQGSAASHHCVVRQSGRVFCWGRDRDGQLGRGVTNATTGVPTAVTFDDGEPLLARQVAVTPRASCAIDRDSSLWCWGLGEQAGLDRNGPQVHPAPVIANGDPSFDAASFAEIAAGRSSFCARSDDGAVWCWGDNEAGEVLGVTGGIRQPTAVATGLGGVQQISLGSQHGCAIDETGRVQCWGANGLGQLGNGTQTASATPTQVVSLPPVKLLECASNYCCALIDDGGGESEGEVWCWGQNSSDQLGRADVDLAATPAPVSAGGTRLHGFTSLAAQAVAVCAVGDGTYCWGSPVYGGTAAGDFSAPTAPARVDTLVGNEVLRNASSVYAGSFFGCAIVEGGRLACWGDDFFGEHAADNDVVLLEPTPIERPVGVLDRAVEADTGGQFGCALVPGGVRCFGSNDRFQLGRGPMVRAVLELPVADDVDFRSPITNTSAVATGIEWACAVADGAPYCWGTDVSSRLGSSGGTATSPRPVTMPATPLGPALDLTIGKHHACAVLEGNTDDGAGHVVCWGTNLSSQLGRSGSDNAPREIDAELTDVRQVAAGDTHTCALRAGGQVWCWGTGSQLGNPTSPSSDPVRAGQLRDVVALDAGFAHNCAIEDPDGGGGIVHCWGVGSDGQLGDGEEQTSSMPVIVLGISNAVSVAAADSHSCAALADGTVRCWGSGALGALGGSFEDSPTPRTVEGLSDVIAVYSGGELSHHTVAIRSDGTAVCWGSNARGACGTASRQVFARPRMAVLDR